MQLIYSHTGDSTVIAATTFTRQLASAAPHRLPRRRSPFWFPSALGAIRFPYDFWVEKTPISHAAIRSRPTCSSIQR